MIYSPSFSAVWVVSTLIGSGDTQTLAAKPYSFEIFALFTLVPSHSNNPASATSAIQYYNIFWFTVCPAGHFKNSANRRICEECPVGTWNNITDQLSCRDCTEGTTTLFNGSISQDLCGKN